MNKLEEYLRQRYLKTRWPYYGHVQTKQEIGESFDSDAKELRDKEMIKPTPGLNGWLVEMIDLNKWNI